MAPELLVIFQVLPVYSSLIYYAIKEESKLLSLNVKYTFLPCSIQYLSPGFNIKGPIRMRIMARAKLIILN